MLAQNVDIQATRDTHAKRILDASDAILAANLSPGEYSVGETVETTAHKAVLFYAHSLVTTARRYHALQMCPGAEGPQGNDADGPTTWTAAVWPAIRSVFAAQPILDWNAVRVALEREHAATTAAFLRDQGGAGDFEEDGGKSKPKVGTRPGNILETMLDKGAVDRDNRISRKNIVVAISPRHKASSYRRAFEGLSRAGYTQGEPGADGGIWLTPAGRDRAEEIKYRNDATRE
jgi:hypothetical protein